jgi:hypothetical protein
MFRLICIDLRGIVQLAITPRSGYSTLALSPLSLGRGVACHNLPFTRGGLSSSRIPN